MFVEELLDLLRQSWTLTPQLNEPQRSFFVGHGKSFVQVWTQDLPLIRARCGHPVLRVASPHEGCGGDKCAPSPIFSAPYAPTIFATRQFPRTKTRRRTSSLLTQPGQARLSRVHPAHR